jgi:hypothetical protein
MIRSSKALLLVLGAVIAVSVLGCGTCEEKPRQVAATHGQKRTRSEIVSLERPADSGRVEEANGIRGAKAAFPLVTRERVARAIERSAIAIGKLELRGDQGWLVGQAARLLGKAYVEWAEQLEVEHDVLRAVPRDPRKVNAALEGAMWKARKLPGRSLPAVSIPRVEPVERVPSSFEREEAVEVLRLMRFALTCEEKSTRDRGWNRMFEKDAAGYLLTHQLLALILAYERGCLDLEEVEVYRRLLAGRLLAEQLAENSAIHDLSVERMAVLCRAGLCGWIPDRDFHSLISSQRAEGSWESRGPENMKDIDWGPHTTALAFYALARRWADTRTGSDQGSPAERPRTPAELRDGG